MGAGSEPSTAAQQHTASGHQIASRACLDDPRPSLSLNQTLVAADALRPPRRVSHSTLGSAYARRTPDETYTLPSVSFISVPVLLLLMSTDRLFLIVAGAFEREKRALISVDFASIEATSVKRTQNSRRCQNNICSRVQKSSMSVDYDLWMLENGRG